MEHQLKALREARDRLRSILETSKVALGPGVAGRAADARRIKVLERALARIRDRAVGKLPDVESPLENRLLTIYIVAVAALADSATPTSADAQRR